jgi:hypothetical protein
VKFFKEMKITKKLILLASIMPIAISLYIHQDFVKVLKYVWVIWFSIYFCFFPFIDKTTIYNPLSEPDDEDYAIWSLLNLIFGLTLCFASVRFMIF